MYRKIVILLIVLIAIGTVNSCASPKDKTNEEKKTLLEKPSLTGDELYGTQPPTTIFEDDEKIAFWFYRGVFIYDKGKDMISQAFKINDDTGFFKMYGSDQWIIYPTKDQRQLVIVSGGNTAPFYYVYDINKETAEKINQPFNIKTVSVGQPMEIGEGWQTTKPECRIKDISWVSPKTGKEFFPLANWE